MNPLPYFIDSSCGACMEIPIRTHWCNGK